ncbi:MAG: hypothetical protein H0T79_00240 [Deltaproteobacteria bacterium]|nr:hypothetical protein [Deltaproteobacteria bacterium]
MRLVALVLLAACGRPDAIAPSSTRALPAHDVVTLDASPKARRRMVPPEVFLRAYLTWFGGLAPIDTFKKARGWNLFDQWSDYLAALGLPDYHLDTPRVTQSNAIMLATLGRLGEALCVRSVEHDLKRSTSPADRLVFVFDPIANPSLADFATRFDVLHRLFLGYPAELAPDNRIARFHTLHHDVMTHHTTGQRLSPEDMGWAAVCTALIQHPEAGLY